ncbi:MAG: TIGR00730 family Rossman fold protein [Saprospiraceae bacterium]|nr:TIGR00730 family Rossman fold protein [Lewinella sp.]
MRSIQVFCGSSTGFNPIYAIAARELGITLAQRQIDLVYGAGSVGLMGIMADAALEAGGKVIGVIPHFLRDWEVCHEGLSELILTDSMDARKVEMLKRSEATIALPGGFGTLDEVFEVITLVQLQQTFQPIGLLNVNGFYNPLLAHIENMLREGFIKNIHRDMIVVEADIEQLLQRMALVTPSSDGKWVNK